MTKKSIKIELTDEGNVILENESNRKIIISLIQKQLDAKEVYDLLDYDSKSKYSLEGRSKYSDEEVSGPKNEKFRLYNYVYEYMNELVKKLDDFQNK